MAGRVRPMRRSLRVARRIFFTEGMMGMGLRNVFSYRCIFFGNGFWDGNGMEIRDFNYGKVLLKKRSLLISLLSYIL